MLTNWVTDKITNIQVITKRFPITVLCIVLSYILSFLFDITSVFGYGLLNVYPFLCVLSLFFLSWSVFSEKEQLPKWPWFPVGLGIGAFLSVDLYFLIENDGFNRFNIFLDTNNAANFAILLFSLFFVLFFAPFIKQGTSGQMWWYRYQVLGHIIISTIACLILSASVGVLYYTLYSLFDIKSEELTLGFFRFLWLIIFPALLLSGIPKTFDEPPALVPLCVKLISYVSAPILLIYGTILYLYAGKIVLTKEMPQGQISLMVIGFALTGILTYTEGFPLRYKENGEKFLSFFKKVFFPVLILPLILLGIAIYQRIDQYGLTEARYIVAMCLGWLCLSVLASFFAKADKFPRIVGLSLAGLLFLAHLPIINPTALSVYSQTQRLRHILETNGLLKDDKIVLPTQAISSRLENDIQGTVSFLGTREGLPPLKSWFSDLPKDKNPFSNKSESSYYLQAQVMTLFQSEGVLTDTLEKKNFNVRIPYTHNEAFTDVQNFSFVKSISLYPNEKPVLIPYGNENRYFSIDFKNNQLTLKGYKETFLFNLSEIAETMAVQEEKFTSKMPYELVSEQNGERVKISITAVLGTSSVQEKATITHIEGTILYKPF